MTIVAAEAARGTSDPLARVHAARVSPITSINRGSGISIPGQPVAVELMTVAELEQAVVDAGQRKPCVNADPEQWFPALGDTPNSASAAAEESNRAAWLCHRCPVKAQCLRLSLESDSAAYGIWGGKSEWERRELRIALRQARIAQQREQALVEASAVLAEVA